MRLRILQKLSWLKSTSFEAIASNDDMIGLCGGGGSSNGRWVTLKLIAVPWRSVSSQAVVVECPAAITDKMNGLGAALCDGCPSSC